MNEIPNHPVYAKNVFEFITVAHDYVETLKKSDSMQVNVLMNYLSKVSPLLYIKGSLLEPVNVTDPDANERFFTEEEQLAGKDRCLCHLVMQIDRHFGRRLVGRKNSRCVVHSYGVGQRLLVRKIVHFEAGNEAVKVARISDRKVAEQHRSMLARLRKASAGLGTPW